MLHRRHRFIRSYFGELRYFWVFAPALLAVVFISSSHLPQGMDARIFASQALVILLYSSISKEAILSNMNRRLILALIKKKGGVTFTEIKQNLGLQNGVLAYHLSLLEKSHYIRSFSDGKYKRFYARGSVVTGLSAKEELIMSVIRSNPYISRRNIAHLIECSQGTINQNIRKLMKKELINMKKIGKHHTYYPRR